MSFPVRGVLGATGTQAEEAREVIAGKLDDEFLERAGLSKTRGDGGVENSTVTYWYSNMTYYVVITIPQ